VAHCQCCTAANLNQANADAAVQFESRDFVMLKNLPNTSKQRNPRALQGEEAPAHFCCNAGELTSGQRPLKM
jgi:hypothetical protein